MIKDNYKSESSSLLLQKHESYSTEHQNMKVKNSFSRHPYIVEPKICSRATLSRRSTCSDQNIVKTIGQKYNEQTSNKL